MAKKLISYDDQKPGLGLPDVVEGRLNSTYGTKAELAEKVSTPAGIADGQVPTWDTGTSQWIAGDGGSSDAVTSQSINRIVASTDPNEPLTEGDLLLVYSPPPTFFHQLSSLAGLTPRWSPAGTFAVVDDPDATDGKAVRFTTGTLGRHLLSLDAADGLPGGRNVEAVVKVKVPGSYSSSGAGIVLRGSGAAGSENGYVITAYNGQLRIFVTLAGGELTLLAQEPVDVLVPNQWFWIRARAHESQVMARTWVDGTAEPAEWTRVVNNTAIPDGGHVGLFGSSTAYPQTWDCLGVGLEGAAAPKGA